MPNPSFRTVDVFVAGGQPTITYNPRSELNLDAELRKYLQTKYKVLSVSGPTKTGKTVLVRRVIPRREGVWISGGQVDSLDRFWELVLHETGGHTEVAAASGTDKETEGSAGGGVEANLIVAKIGAKSEVRERTGSSQTTTTTRKVSPATAAVQALREQGRPLVVDDFHYISREVQEKIVRALKDLVFEGVPVILISVPHRAFDAVKVEREMTGRVAQLSVPVWKDVELAQIAQKGFEALKVNAASEVLERLIRESFSSPHLMQDFCGELCRSHGVHETLAALRELGPPADWDAFFRSKASETAKREFERLRTGPRERTDRKKRLLTNGQACDIYTAVLLGIARAGPPQEITAREVRNELKEILKEGIPETHEITRVLEQMSSIASEKIEGEPVVDWDPEFGKLHITDPFFAFYLRWGTRLP